MKDQAGPLHRLAGWIDKKLRPEDADDPVWPDAPPADDSDESPRPIGAEADSPPVPDDPPRKD
jgi:hypothetical protein